MAELNRRTFLAGATAATVALASGKQTRAAGANDEVVLAVMGVNGRGSQLIEGFAKQPGVRFAYVCDCDERAIEKGLHAVAQHAGGKAKGVKDFREALDDRAVDALVCAAPNHWHAAATILACAAGKHVYVEKPASQTPDEGERMVAAARSAKRVVQVGTQRRSGPLYKRVFERVREGAIGRALYAKSEYYAERPTIGRGKQISPPAWLDYELWQGPAPARPYQDNVVHYNWHFFWHWGNGELGNNGVHTIDICRAALGVDYPTKVTASGTKLRYEDDQETPDTCIATFDCGGRELIWEGISWSRQNQLSSQLGMWVRGENGEVYVDDNGYKLYDLQGKVVESDDKLGRGDAEHLHNFLDAIRNGAELNADIEEGHKSALFCHLGNIAYRTGQTLTVDPTNGHIVDNTAASAMWAREYRDGWMPKV
jgi:predicted dehydrogenase